MNTSSYQLLAAPKQHHRRLTRLPARLPVHIPSALTLAHCNPPLLTRPHRLREHNLLSQFAPIQAIRQVASQQGRTASQQLAAWGLG